MLIGVLAMGEEGVIGHQGKLPWHLPDDLRRFKELTWQRSVLMGRKTFESLGRWLPHRNHLILTHQPDYVPPWGTPPSASDYMVVTETDIPLLSESSMEIFVAGGVEVFRLTRPHLRKLHLTSVVGVVHGDVKVQGPLLDPSYEWEMVKEAFHPADAFHSHPFYIREFIRL